MRKLLFFVFLLFALINRGLAQTGYPIFVTPTLTPPYSLKLSEYSKFGSQRMVVNIAVNDLNISNLPVKLHIKLETVGVTIETPATINTTPIYLDGGAVTILFGDDLTDYFNINNLIFKGYSKETYRRTGQLPEGFYKITVEVLHYQTNRLISNSGTATAWITLGKPPVLKLPENNKVMGEFKGMPLTFSWLPCNLGNPVSAGSVQYKFEMWELRIDGVSPYVVASTVPVFYEETTRNTLLSVYPATMLMEPGMKYAWRITASDMLGNVPFEQDGHSEIRVFSYKSKCDSVTNFKADARGRSGLFGWQPRSNHTSYNVELRNPETGWLSASETFDNKVEFHDLEYGSTYEIRTQAVCDNDPSSLSDFTAWHRLTINDQRTKLDSASCPNCGCDDNIIPKEIENLELNRNLKSGDTLVNRAGTTRFIVKTATQQGDGVYKGIFLFWAELWKVKFVCEYWDLSANTDNVILNMDFKSVYNPQFLLDVDVMTAYLDSLASAITTLTINTTISDTLTVNGSISTVYVNEGDSVIVVTVGENGELTEIVIGTNSDDLGHTLITGEDGEEYVVTGNGEVMGVDEFKNTGGNDRKIEEYKEEKESHLSATTVNFAASPTQKYGFDAYSEQKQALRNGYPALGNGYVPSYKSVASFATDKVVPSSFEKGITFRDEMGIPAVTSGGELTLRGRADGTVTSLYAYKAVTDTTEEVAGKLEVMSYDQQVKKLYIVPVNNAKLPDVTALQNVLNTVYAQAVTRWEVVPINESVPVTFPNGQMTHGGSSAIAVYNADQNAIISKFKEKNNLESNALYLFFVDNVVGKTGDVAGYMPLQRQVGFIYDNPNLFVIAHELGHGAFNLRHTFSPENFIAAEHSTQNLMDYNGGTELWKHQWEFIRDPQSVWFAWAQDESEGEMQSDDLDRLLKILKYSGTNSFAFGIKCSALTTESDGMVFKIKGESYHVFFMKYSYVGEEIEISTYDFDENSIPTNLNVEGIDIPDELDKFIVLNRMDAGVIIPHLCNDLKEDYSKVCETGSLKSVDSLYTKFGNDIMHCFDALKLTPGGYTLSQITDILIQLQSEARANQQFEFTQNGLVYRLNEQGQAEIIEDALSDANINAGKWTDERIDMKMRVGFNADGILQFSAMGIRNNLQLAKVNGVQKTASLTNISTNMLTKGNALLKEHQVKDIETTLNSAGANLDSDAFPDGKKVEIDKEATFVKIICEAGGIGLSFLKTAEIEQPVYFEQQENTIKAPPIATGTIESVGMVVTDISSAVITVYDIVTDEESCAQAIEGFVQIGKQIKDNPSTLFPILLDVVLEEFTGATADNFDEMTSDATNKGRKHHLTTKTTVRTTVSVFTSGKILSQLPEMSLEVAKKMAKEQFFNKLDDLGDVTDDVLDQFRKKLKALPDGGENLLDDFKDLTDAESLKKLVDNPDFVDNWKRLDDAGVDESIRRNAIAVTDPDAVEDAIQHVEKQKPTWPEIQALWKRGNDFNAKRKFDYRYSEVWIEHPTNVYPSGHKNAGKPRRYRLDSYDDVGDGKIVSRKATTLSDIKTSTFENYLKELVDKYPEGAKIANSDIGTTLKGKFYLEIPDSNKAFFEGSEELKKLAKDYNVTIVFKPE